MTENVENKVIEETAAPKRKKFKATDVIECMSITSGELGMIGIKSRINYKWATRGDVTEVEYQDLRAAVMSNVSHITKPYFIIQDEDFIAEFPALKKAYEAMYSVRDLKDVLKMPVRQMKKTILSLPDGAKQSIKNIAATQIANGQLDSVQKIRTIDEIFGTELMLMTGLFK